MKGARERRSQQRQVWAVRIESLHPDVSDQSLCNNTQPLLNVAAGRAARTKRAQVDPWAGVAAAVARPGGISSGGRVSRVVRELRERLWSLVAERLPGWSRPA